MSTEVKKISTKACPQCGNEKLITLRTHNLKVCTDCKVNGKSLTIPWYLDPGQVTLK